MSRIEVPKPAQQKSSAPSWINKEALLQVSGKEAEKNQETLSKIKSGAQIFVLSYFNPKNNAVFSADDPRLLAQMRLQERQGNTSFKFKDPDTTEPLFAYKTAKKINKKNNLRYSNTELKPEKGGTYTNTFIDRHIAYKALEEMQRYASSKGMTIPRARYIRSAYGAKQLGSNLVTINNIFTELEWNYGRNQKGRVFATISVDPAGKFIHPLTFKIASGEDFEFSEDNIRMLEKDARFMEMTALIKPKKTDIPTFRRPDISRFMATASMNKESADPAAPVSQPAVNTGQPATNPATSITPTAPGTYEAGTQYTNPADGKIYTMKSYDPNAGAVVTSPEGQDMAVPANEVANLQPMVQTQAKKSAFEFSVEAMAEEMVQKHLREDIKGDTQHAKELHGLADEEQKEVSEDEQLSLELSSKKMVGEKIKTAFDLEGFKQFLVDKVITLSGEEADDLDLADNVNFVRSNIKSADSISEIEDIMYDYGYEDFSTLTRKYESTITEASKKLAGEKGNCDNCGKPNFICRGKCSDKDEGLKDEDLEDDDTDKESSLPILGTKTANKNIHFSHVPQMSKRWNEIRKGLREKISKEKGSRPFDLAPEKISREQQESNRLTSVGYKGYSPLNNDANEYGRDAKTHIPTSTSGDAEIGMTEYPEFSGESFQDAQQEMVDRREHFQNQDKLRRNRMKREEVEEYNDGSYKDKGYGLSETSRDKEFENPELQFEASNDALAKEMIQKKSMEEGGSGIKTLSPDKEWQPYFDQLDELWDKRGNALGYIRTPYDDKTEQQIYDAWKEARFGDTSKRTAAEEGEESPIQERPIVHKDMKKAPGLEGYKEPETIGEAEGKVKEGVTKLHKVQSYIKELKENLRATIAPLQKKLQEAQKPFNEDLIKQQESLSSYLEMIYMQLSQTDDKIAAYEDKIFAVIERSKDEKTKVSMPQLLKKLEATDKVLFDSVMKVKEAMENEVVTSVLERFLYEYPVSKQHELKKVVRKSTDEEGSFNNALKVLKEALMGLLNISDALEVDLEAA